MIYIDVKRHVLPRWRSLASTISRGELRSGEMRADRQAGLLGRMRRLETVFRAEPSLESAADVVSFAVAWGLPQSHSVVDAAKLTERDASDNTAVHGLALRVLGADMRPDAPTDAHTRIAGLKHRVRQNPRDAISWMELARWYSTIGQVSKARSAVMVAVELVDSNRYVVRSASRFFCHIGELDSAEWVLRRASDVNSDAWLLASLVAVCHLSGSMGPPQLGGRKVLERILRAPFENSELAAALGSIELESGNSRFARKLFRASLVEPAENSIAQVAWATRAGMNLDVPSNLARERACYEALAWELAGAEAISEAIARCKQWLREEPFSSQPAILGSYLGVVTGLYPEEAVGLAEDGLRANPDDTMLLNNYAAALASAGRLEAAGEALARIRRAEMTPRSRVAVRATEGLLEFRSGNISLGEAYYREAIRDAEDTQIEFLGTMAEMHLEIERVLAGQKSERLHQLIAPFTDSDNLGMRLVAGRGHRVLLASLDVN